ncbi:MAG: HU family DNA-binding protein [Prevotella sp.]|nr:HU family DNA-binding protein [Prevotella sp.]
MGKLSISEIAQVLVGNKGLSQKDAENFVAAMFDIIQTALERDKLVKIKGLGTFKIIDVEARESINVNSGERVVIEGHGKVTFTPDASMKELVNKPFSQFETVILNEGVEFDDIEEEDSTEKEVSSDELAKDDEPEVIPVAVAEEPISVTLSDNSDREKAIEQYIDSLAGNYEEQESVAEEPVAEPEPVVEVHVAEEPVKEELVAEPARAIEPVEEKTTFEEPVEEEPVAQQDVAEDANDEQVADSEEDGETDDDEVNGNDDEEEERSSNLKWWIFSAVSLVLIALAAYGGYLYGLETAKKQQAPFEFVAPADSVEVSEPVVDTLNVVVPDSMAQENASDSVIVPVKKDTVAVAVKTEPQFDSEKYERMDNRVRTGAYRIVGTDYTVVVRQGETMKRLCKRTLGEGMACYIEVYNDMEPNAPLVAGTKIKIPKLEWKRKK